MRKIRSNAWRDWLALAPLPPLWRVAVFVAAGVAFGGAVLVGRASRALSYLSEDPASCINCHVMDNAYATWRRGSHGRVTTCADCHLPHDNPIRKLAFKAQDGARHSYVFTFRLEPQENCLRCHADQFQMVRLVETSERRCWDCHQNIHGEVISLAGTPDARRPRLPSAGLEWFKRQLEDPK